MLEKIKNLLRVPYHFLLQYFSAVLAGFPARKLVVICVGGTKGKSTLSEMIFAILTEAGHTPALVGTIRFAVGAQSEPNKLKMTMPGRGLIQRFLARARAQGATHAIIEVTTEGARQFRHRFLYPDVMLMTNVQKEHIESHGSFEKYVARKWELVRELETSPKKTRTMVVNTDDEWNAKFLNARVPKHLPYSLRDIPDVQSTDRSVSFSYGGTEVRVPLQGTFNAVNALGALKVAESQDIPLATAVRALAKLNPVRGRVEFVDSGQDFAAVVDYAHTPDSLRALYGAFPGRKICVLGNTGGGRDRWKRSEMAKIAEGVCAQVILTDEDPYDEDPRAIIDEMARAMVHQPTIILDRRTAIREALLLAKTGDTVLISGKGTDPYIMGPKGFKTPWDDATVVREELEKLKRKS